MPETVRWFCKCCDTTVKFKLTKEFKEIFLKNAKYFPYPVIFKHNDNCYTILHLDSDFNDRGTVNTEILVDLSSDKYRTTMECVEVIEDKEIKEVKEQKTMKLSLDDLSGMTFDVTPSAEREKSQSKKTSKKKTTTKKKSTRKKTSKKKTTTKKKLTKKKTSKKKTTTKKKSTKNK